MDGLPRTAHSVVLRHGQPVQPRLLGDGLELLGGQVPVRQMRRCMGGGGSDEPVVGVPAEGEVLIQEDSLKRGVSGVVVEWWSVQELLAERE